jgi:hypothetical protein
MQIGGRDAGSPGAVKSRNGYNNIEVDEPFQLCFLETLFAAVILPSLHSTEALQLQGFRASFWDLTGHKAASILL